MTKKTFEVGDQIGRYKIIEFAGADIEGIPQWRIETLRGNEGILSEAKLRIELRNANLTPEYVRGLSAKAYDELLKEVGQEVIDRVLKRSGPTNQAPSEVHQREIADKWFSWHPQVPRTRANARVFDEYLAAMANPTFTSKDFDRAFSDLFFKLELNPKAAGIEGIGDGIRGEAAIRKLTSERIAQLQKSFPVKPPVDFSKLSQDEILNQVAKVTTSAQFDQWTKEVDKEKGVEQPVPPLLLAAREKIWANFFELHSDLVPTEELQAKLLKVLSENNLSVLNQHLDTALDLLVQSGDPVVARQEPNTRTAGSTRWVMNKPRPIGAAIVVDEETPVTVTVAEINAMDASQYAAKCLNPAFRKAVNELYERFGRV